MAERLPKPAERLLLLAPTPGDEPSRSDVAAAPPRPPPRGDDLEEEAWKLLMGHRGCLGGGNGIDYRCRVEPFKFKRAGLAADYMRKRLNGLCLL